MTGWPYDVLELPADATEREIKRAYARLLKVTHPEDAPDDFKRLRAAYEDALSAAGPAPAPSAAPWGARPEPEAPAPRLEPAEPKGNREARAAVLEIQGRMLKAMAGGSKAELRDQFDSLLNLPLPDNVQFQLEFEERTAQFLALNPGDTDALLDPAVAHFGWDLAARASDRSPAVQALLQRRDDLAQLHRLRGSELHSFAFRFLRRPLPPAWRLIVVWRCGQIIALLNRLGSSGPAMVEALNFETLVAVQDFVRHRHFRRWVHLSILFRKLAFIGLITGGYYLLFGRGLIKSILYP